MSLPRLVALSLRKPRSWRLRCPVCGGDVTLEPPPPYWEVRYMCASCSMSYARLELLTRADELNEKKPAEP